jgi:SAM-dependent methyltransferase
MSSRRRGQYEPACPSSGKVGVVGLGIRRARIRIGRLVRRDARRWEGAPVRWGPNTRHPNEAPRNRLAYRQLSAALEYAAGRYAAGRLIDVGCGDNPWRTTFRPYIEEHIGIDHGETLHGLADVDIVADAYDIPLADRSVDTVLLTEVLEHLEEPAKALAECRRVLRPGGYLIATTPFSWPLHEHPRDFFRYSPYGLRHLSDAAGLEVAELRPLSGIWTTLSLHLSWALLRYRPHAARLVDAASVAAQRLAWCIERVDRNETLSWNHLLVARRP